MRDFWLVIHFLSLVAGVGAGFSHFVMLQYAKKLPPEKRADLVKSAAFLTRVAPLGLIGLIVSGLFMTWPLWQGLKLQGLFHAKLTLVFILSGLIVYVQILQRKARKEGPASIAGQVKIISPTIQAINFCIILLAVLVFH